MVIRELLAEVICAMADNGIENARMEGRWLLQGAGLTRLQLAAEPSADVPAEVEDNARQMLARRLGGEPLQYILGEWELCGFPFKVGEGVLIPRQDTETLVRLAQEYLGERGGDAPLAADLCAGSGCIGISLAGLCGCRVDCYEISEAALRYLSENITLNAADGAVRPISADVLSEQTAANAPEYDMIISNPPYLTQRDMDNLQTEVSFEPREALFGGEDGLDFYRGITALWTPRLRYGGLFAVEIGIGQESDVMRIFAQNGLSADCVKDSCGIYRVVYAVKN